MSQPRFHKGDLVRFRLGTRLVQGEVKEDRGPIGIKGRHLYLIEFRPEALSIARSEVELPAEELQAVQDSVTMD